MHPSDAGFASELLVKAVAFAISSHPKLLNFFRPQKNWTLPRSCELDRLGSLKAVPSCLLSFLVPNPNIFWTLPLGAAQQPRSCSPAPPKLGQLGRRWGALGEASPVAPKLVPKAKIFLDFPLCVFWTLPLEAARHPRSWVSWLGRFRGALGEAGRQQQLIGRRRIPRRARLHSVSHRHSN